MTLQTHTYRLLITNQLIRSPKGLLGRHCAAPITSTLKFIGRHMRTIVISLLFISVQAFAGDSNKDCYQTAMTQTEINICSGEKLRDSDSELNRVFQEIKSKYSNNPDFLRKLKNSQLAWIKFRDAEIEAIFPVEEPGYYGSSMQMCRGDWLRKITDQRISELKKWLEPVKDGEMCGGSINQYEN